MRTSLSCLAHSSLWWAQEAQGQPMQEEEEEAEKRGPAQVSRCYSIPSACYLFLLLLFGWFWWGCVYPHATVVMEPEG